MPEASKYFLRIILSPQALKNSSTTILLNHLESGEKTHISVSKKTNGWTILNVPDPKYIFILFTDASFAIVMCVGEEGGT